MMSLRQKGNHVTLTRLHGISRKEMNSDMTREIAPLKKAEDAILVDSSDMTIDEVVSKICSFCN